MTLEMTPEGRRKLERNLDGLEQELASVLLEKADAAETGGNVWHDNFAFEDVERRERALRVKIGQLRTRLSQAVTVKRASSEPVRVEIGTTVLLELDDGAERTFSVGGHGESDPGAGLISTDSPLGKAILHATPGERRTFRIRSRERHVIVKELKKR